MWRIIPFILYVLLQQAVFHQRSHTIVGHYILIGTRIHEKKRPILGFSGLVQNNFLSSRGGNVLQKLGNFGRQNKKK